MKISAQEIYYLSTAYRNICESKCETSECLDKVLTSLMYQNVLQASYKYHKELNKCDDDS